MAMDVQAEILIQAARTAVWRQYADVSAWPVWHRQIQAAYWLRGEAWTDGAILQLTVAPLFVPVTVRVSMKMVAAEHLVVWECRLPGLAAVHVFEFSDSLGGCLVREKETYHGLLSPVMFLLRHRQRQAFAQALLNLKGLVERNRAREL